MKIYLKKSTFIFQHRIKKYAMVCFRSTSKMWEHH